MKKISSIFIFFFIFSSFLFGQEKVKLEYVKGSAQLSNDISLKKAKLNALNDAKLNALKQAGVEEFLNSYSNLYTIQNNKDFIQLFDNKISTELKGSVTNVNIISEKKEIVETKIEDIATGKISIKEEILITIEINCTVIKYNSEKDLSFNAWINGINKFYENQSSLIFRIKPTKNCFLKIFLFTENEAFIIFPNDYEINNLLKKDKVYNFPCSEIEYRLKTKKESEVHIILFVFTKVDIPFTNKVNTETITDWIYSIPIDKRYVKTYNFMVTNNK